MAITRKRMGTKAVLKIPKPHAAQKARLQRLTASTELNPISHSQIYRAKQAIKAAKKALAHRIAERFALQAAPKPTSKRPRKTDASKLALKIIKMRRSPFLKRAYKNKAKQAITTR